MLLLVTNGLSLSPALPRTQLRLGWSSVGVALILSEPAPRCGSVHAPPTLASFLIGLWCTGFQLGVQESNTCRVIPVTSFQ